VASRKSRSFANPAYREDVLRYSPEEAYRNAVRDVNHRVVQYVQQAYRSDPRFLTSQGHVDRLTAMMAPMVQAGQVQVADLTNAHLSTLFGVKHPPAPNLSEFAREGVTATTELARPFWTAIKAAQAGKDFDAAMAAGEARLTKMVQTDLQMAKVRQARDVLKAGGIQRYARVTGGTACWLCEIAATQVYYTEDLLPIHPSCNCSVQPIPDGGEAEIRDGFTPDEIFQHATDQVKLMAGLVENEAPLEDYQKLVEVRDHGEIGPMLTWKHQNFTGPGDLPVPPSKEVLNHQAGIATPAMESADRLRIKAGTDPASTDPWWVKEDMREGQVPRRFVNIEMGAPYKWYPDSPYTTKEGKWLENRHPGLVTSFSNIEDPTAVKQFVNGFDKMAQKYPEVTVTVVNSDNLWQANAQTEYHTSVSTVNGKLRGLVESKVTLNRSDSIPEQAKKLRDTVKESPSVYGQIYPNGKHDIFYGNAVHEYGHVMVHAGDYQATEAEAKQVLKQMWKAQKGEPGGIKLYGEWFESAVPYSYARTSIGETLAECFKDVELNGSKASDVSKAMHKIVVDNYNNQVPVMERRKPSRKSPSKIVAEKEATRGEKYLAQYQKKAEKFTKDAEAQAKRDAAAAKKAAAAAAKAEKAAAKEAQLAAEAELRGPPPGETRKLLPNGDPLPDKAERVSNLRARKPELVANQGARYEELTDQEKINGRRWYADQCTTAANQAIDGGHGFTPLQGVSVNGALSPQTKYPINTAQGERYLSVPRGEGNSAIRKMPISATNAMGTNAERADRLSTAKTFDEMLTALHEKTDAKKLTNYISSAWVKAHPEDIADRAKLFTVDTWAVRTMDHSQQEIRDVLKLPAGTRLSERQESRGELLLSSKKYGTHWEWSKGKGKWVELPNYRAVDMIGDDYDVFQEAGVEAASKASEFAGTYESRFNEATGRFETVMVDDKPSKWLPEDYQAALWGQIVPAAPPGV
jgi:hypothetical protein